MAGRFILVSGNEESAIKDKARELAALLCACDPDECPDLETIRGDSDEKKADAILAELLNSLSTPPFLSEKKIIWLKHFQNFDLAQIAPEPKKTPKPLQAHMASLSEMLKAGLPDDIALLIDGPGLDRRKAFYKLCEKSGEVHFLGKNDASSKEFPREQYLRIKTYFADNGIRAGEDALEYLSETLGADYSRVKNELEKLICYVGESKSVTLEDCRQACSRSSEAMSWDFANALVERDAVRAIAVIGDTLATMRGSGELAILSIAIKSFQEIVRVHKALAELGLNPKRVDKNSFYSMSPEAKERHPDNFLLSLHPFRAYMICRNAARFNDRELAASLSAILDANRQMVSGGGDARLILEQLALKISGGLQ